MTPVLARAILLLCALAFAGFGVAFTSFAEPMARTVDIELATDVARTDFIATYGGFELGFAAFLLLCWRRVDWVRIGLLASGCALAGFATTRAVGMSQSAALSPLMLTVLVAETLGSVASFWGAAQIRDEHLHGR